MIGVDIGTTNCKICLFSLPSYRMIDQSVFQTPKFEIGDETDFDIESIWLQVKSSLLEVGGKVGRQKIKAISIASIGESGVLLNQEDEVIGPAIAWYDTRTVKQETNLREKLGMEKVYDITGLPSHSNYSVNKIKWIRDHVEGASAEQSAVWLSISGYLAYKLCGEKRTEYSLASRTLALSIKERTWSEEILHVLEESQTLFPPFVEGGEPIGCVLTTVAPELAGIPVAIAGHDHMVGSIATELLDEEGMVNSTGTTEGLLTLQKEPQLNEGFRRAHLSNGIHVLPNYHTIFASLPTAGLVVEWVKKIFHLSDNQMKREIEELTNNYLNGSSLGTDLVFIPHLRGSGPPDRLFYTRGNFYGMTDQTTRSEIILAVFEGLCFELKKLQLTMENLLNKPFHEIKVIGAAAKNELWLQLKADILQREIVVYENEENVARGAAMVAALKMDVLKKEEIRHLVTFRRYFPNDKRAQYYQRKYVENYKALSSLLTKWERERHHNESFVNSYHGTREDNRSL